jgi:hypothetical protein
MQIKSVIAAVVLTASIIGPTFPVSAATTQVNTKYITLAESEKLVRGYFKDIPVMIEIARCESDFRQFADSGDVLRSAGMIGVFQFFESIHTTGAKALGFDLATLEGNLGYAKHVYETQGTTPWNGSSYCWKTSAPTTVTSTVKREKLLAQISTLTKLISTLQKQLSVKKRSR